MHRQLDELPDTTDLVIADASVAELRRPDRGDQPVPLRVRGPSSRGRARVLGVLPSGGAQTVNLLAADRFMSAGSSGGAIAISDERAAWEEFLPIAAADIAILQELPAARWMSIRDRRILPRGSCQLGTGFKLAIGDGRISLRGNASLVSFEDGHAFARRLLLLAEDGRIERLQRYDPIVVFRSDGTPDADEQIDLGLASLLAHTDPETAVFVETGRSPEEFRATLSDAHASRVVVVQRDMRGAGLIAFARPLAGLVSAHAGPVLCLANGVLCDGDLDGVFGAIAASEDIVVTPWLRAPLDAARTQPFFEIDPRADAAGPNPEIAIIGFPELGRWLPFERLADSLQQRVDRPADVTMDDGFDSDLLRALLAATGRGNDRALRSHVRTLGPNAAEHADAPRGLLNLRPCPPEIRADVMRRCLDQAAGRS